MHTLNFPGDVPAPERLIFAADDDAGDLLLLARLLEQPGIPYPCRLFASGETMMDALLNVLRGAPAPLLCFLDVKMGRMSGFDVLRWIRCQDAFDAVPVVMLSGSNDPHHPDDAAGLGAQCFAKKFPSAIELRRLVAEAQRYAADHSTPAAFHLPCNLLVACERPAPGVALV